MQGKWKQETFHRMITNTNLVVVCGCSWPQQAVGHSNWTETFIMTNTNVHITED